MTLLQSCEPAFAGIDFTGRSDQAMEVRNLTSEVDGVIYGHKTKWNDLIIHAMYRKIREMEVRADIAARSETEWGVKDAGRILERIGWYERSVAIMEAYKAKGINYDTANSAMVSIDVSSEAYYAKYPIPEFKDKKDALLWAHKLNASKIDLNGYRRALNRKIRQLGDLAYPRVAGAIYAQIKPNYEAAGEIMMQAYYCEVARNVIVTVKMEPEVGAAFYCGSVPVEH